MSRNELSESNILRFIIERWKQQFVGVSALDIAEHFNKPHEEIIRLLRGLEVDGKIRLRETKLGLITIGIQTDKDTNKGPERNLRQIDTLIAFPNRAVLQEVFRNDGKTFGVFTDRLHKGDCQLQHYYFSQDVLDRYLSYPDRYLISDDIVQGRITMKSAYYFSLAEDERDKQGFDRIRYGKGKLKNGGIVIAAMAIDLSNLPAKEQEHWSACEIEGAEFAGEDEEFKEYHRMMIDGEFGNYEDPIEGIFRCVKSINNAFGLKLFKNDSKNPYLRYPVKNTTDAYQNAHKELFKLLGPDSLDIEALVGLLKNRMGVEEEDLKGSKQKFKGKWELLKMLVERVPGASFEPLERCYEAKQKDAHKVDEAKLPNTDLRETFRQDCLEILKTLEIVASYLREHVQ